LKKGKNVKTSKANLDPPAPVQLSAESKGIWQKIVREWELDTPALLILETALGALDRIRQAEEMIRKDGIVIADARGNRKKHPAVAVEKDAKASLVRNLKALGLDLEPLNPGPGRPKGR
jgi:P27 family predicted phage terminase small subunit